MNTLQWPDTVPMVPLAPVAYLVPVGPGLLHLFQFQFQNPLLKNKELTSLPLLVKGASKGSSIITNTSKSFCSQVNFQLKLKKTKTDLEKYSLLPIYHQFCSLFSRQFHGHNGPSPPPVFSIPPNVSPRPQQPVSPSPEPVRTNSMSWAS